MLEQNERGSISFLAVEDLGLGEKEYLPGRDGQLRGESAIEQRNGFLIFSEYAVDIGQIPRGGFFHSVVAVLSNVIEISLFGIFVIVQAPIAGGDLIVRLFLPVGSIEIL